MARFTFYEFFAGGGMARAGLGPEWQCLFANDFDSKKGAAYRENWGDAELRVGDVRHVVTADLPGKADLVWASFPCQDLSLAGFGAGLKGERSGAFWPFWRLMENLRTEGRKPRSIVLENVCGLLTANGGADFASLCETLSGAGYWIGAMVIDAQLFVPQSRPRLFLIALDRLLPVPGGLQKSYAVDRWHPERLRHAQAELSQRSRSAWLWFDPPTPALRNVALIDVIEEAPSDVSWRSDEATSRLLAMMSPVNRAKIDLVARNGGRGIGAVYKRTRVEGGRKVQRAEVRFDMAGCLRTPGGGSSRQIILVVEDGNARSRLISGRETARLMGLPEEYMLPERYNDAYHLTGDGVAVPVVRHISEHLIEPVLRPMNVPVQFLRVAAE